ncbi:hypothetical protein HBI11_070160 [Parastagonospora nodorum]|nr:hypothetical protein HBI11_070160 [Parastagonospora nodorum]KAH6314909.1 hypothetical protein HBI39_035870 [Parastagonospora nodorum]KAH6432588.1 hypothetical protein HBI08_030450 [Parastagonospora nodorum]
MAASTGMAGLGEPDMALIAELLEDVSRNPPAIAARKLLVEHYISVGWLEAATDNAKDLKTLAPRDPDVTRYLETLQRKPDPPAPEKQAPSVVKPPVTETREWDPKTGRYKKVAPAKHARKLSQVQDPEVNSDLDATRQDLTQGYTALRAKARSILADLLHLQNLQRKAGLPPSKNVAKVQAIAEGGGVSQSITTNSPGSARSVARRMRDRPEEAASIAISDLEDTVKWIRVPHGKPSGADDDAVRDVLVKRTEAVQSTLPDNLKIHCEHALMHVEHELLTRNYANTETMLGDEIKDIPRANFYVTEDNYAWCMDELVQAITANNGVLRNPLSREMFTPKDIKGILLHPIGKPLAALGVAQHEMSKGIRSDTIVHMEKLSNVLLTDQSADTLPSRKAVDEFLAYVATLPELEQKAIEQLKCPARDSHTGQAYDFSIGEAVLDAKGNRVCFHKTGDFIKQAASYLRQNQGAAPDQDPNTCSVM